MSNIWFFLNWYSFQSNDEIDFLLLVKSILYEFVVISVVFFVWYDNEFNSWIKLKNIIPKNKGEPNCIPWFGFCFYWVILFILKDEHFNSLFSELGQVFSNSFDEIKEEVGQINWYLFPIGIQRMLPITIANVQQPVLIKSFGNILCLRDQFKKVSSYLLFCAINFKHSIVFRSSMRHTNTLWCCINFTNKYDPIYCGTFKWWNVI